MEKKNNRAEKTEELQETVKTLKCGIVMPIARHTDYPANHWNDVLDIITEAIDETDFEPSLVSASLEIGLIQERIVNNLYSNEIVICDVSSKNPNVMFELGLRLAFDKPTIIIKDEKSNYSFDIGGIEHLSYPSSLRFSDIKTFKQDLIKRVNASYQKSLADKNYSPFLKSFGTNIVPTKINQKDISETDFVMNSLLQIKSELAIIKHQRSDRSDRNDKNISALGLKRIIIQEIERFVSKSDHNIKSPAELLSIQSVIFEKTSNMVPLQLINDTAIDMRLSDLPYIETIFYDELTGQPKGRSVKITNKNGQTI